MPSNPMLPKNNQMNVYNPTGKGTLIADLLKRNDNVNNTDENSMYNKHKSHSETQNNVNSIKKLADDVNISLHELENIDKNRKNRKNRNYKTMSESIIRSNDLDYDIDNIHDYRHVDNKDNDIVSVETVEIYYDYINIFIEFILLITVYVVMSQPFVISNLSKYIYQLHPTENGDVKLTGILVYGLILTILFIVLRSIVLKKIR